MDNEWQRRVEALEEEVRSLREEVTVLKALQHPAKQASVVKREMPKAISATGGGPKSEESAAVRTAVPQQAAEPKMPGESSKSFEERLVAALPKVFMLIFVLGVLWGLKLISDYGMLADGMKIVLAYLASAGLAILSFALEKKGRSVRAMHTALYGGSFAVGVLATAAAVLIYGVMSTMPALFIALAYIIYGIMLCHWKGSEGLTIFVMFTSLLLPYLLEYMEFNSLIVIGFVVVLFAAIQVVLATHGQRLALYVTALFAGLSTLILYLMGDRESWIYPYGWLAIIATFFVGWIATGKNGKWPRIQEGLLYSYGVVGITFLHVFYLPDEGQTILFTVSTLIIVAFALWMKRRGDRNATDIFAAVAIVGAVNGLLAWEMDGEWRTVIILTTAAIGMLLGIRIEAPVMKLTNVALLVFTTFIIFGGFQVEGPLELLMHVLAISYFIAGIYYSEKRKAASFLTVWLEKVYWAEITRIATYWLLVLFIAKLDTSYITEGYTLYFTLSFIALSCAAALMAPRRITGIALPVLLLAIMSFCTLVVWSSINRYEGVLLQGAMHLIYIAVWGALVLDLHYKGMIYRRHEKHLEPRFEQLFIVGWLVVLVNLWNMAYFILEIGFIPEFVYIIFATCLLFACAAAFIIFGRKYNMELVLKAGFVLLILAIGKLVFVDLSSLDLLVRAIVFLVIGAIGLLLSNRLLKKE